MECNSGSQSHDDRAPSATAERTIKIRSHRSESNVSPKQVGKVSSVNSVLKANTYNGHETAVNQQ